MSDITFIVVHNMLDVDQLKPFLIPDDKLVGFVDELADLVHKYARLKT